MKEFEIVCRDNYKLYGTEIIPNNDFEYIIYILHGMCEHKERYYKFMQYLSDAGYATIICDLRGHGYHEDKYNLGYFGDKKALIEDTDEVINYIKEKYKDKKIILFGHSMGSLIARNYIQNNDSKIDKLILCGPPTINIGAGLGIALSKLISGIKGDHYRSKFIYNISLGSYERRNEMKNAWLINDKEVLEEYNKDDYCGFIFTSNGFISLFYMLKRAYKRKYKLCNKNMPILLLAGTEDRVVGSKYKFRHLHRFFNRAGYDNVESHSYEGMRHELYNEKDKELVFKDIDNFSKRI